MAGMMGMSMATGALGGGMAGIGSYFAKKGTRKNAPKPIFDPVSKYQKAGSFLMMAPQYAKIMSGEMPWYGRLAQQAGLNQAMRAGQMTGQKILQAAGRMGQGGELGTLKAIKQAREAGIMGAAKIAPNVRMGIQKQAQAGLQQWSMLQPTVAGAKGRRGPGLVSSMHAGGFTGLGSALSSGGASATQKQLNAARGPGGGGSTVATPVSSPAPVAQTAPVYQNQIRQQTMQDPRLTYRV